MLEASRRLTQFNYIANSQGHVPRRPPTTDMVARRLVHGALGVRAPRSKEQRQAEKDVLKSARGNCLSPFS